MIQPGRVLEVCAVDGELVEGVELAFHAVLGAPGVGGAAFQDVHSMVHSWACVVAEHVRFWRRLIIVWICGKDYVPFVVDVV